MCILFVAMALLVVCLGLLLPPALSLGALSLSAHRASRTRIAAAVVSVALPDRSYPIYIGTDLLADASPNNCILKHVTSKKALIVTNTKIGVFEYYCCMRVLSVATLLGPLYSKQVRAVLESANIEVFEVQLPDGEEYKTMDVCMKIIDAAMDAKLDRKSTMIALGGGVVGDMTGFAAAIYQRGIRFIQIPTSLMAMVDSAVGGKTGVNHPGTAHTHAPVLNTWCIQVYVYPTFVNLLTFIYRREEHDRGLLPAACRHNTTTQ